MSSGMFDAQNNAFNSAVNNYMNNFQSVAQSRIMSDEQLESGKQQLFQAQAGIKESADVQGVEGALKKQTNKMLSELGIDMSIPGVAKGLSMGFKYTGRAAQRFGLSQEKQQQFEEMQRINPERVDPDGGPLDVRAGAPTEGGGTQTTTSLTEPGDVEITPRPYQSVRNEDVEESPDDVDFGTQTATPSTNPVSQSAPEADAEPVGSSTADVGAEASSAARAPLQDGGGFATGGDLPSQAVEVDPFSNAPIARTQAPEPDIDDIMADADVEEPGFSQGVFTGLSQGGESQAASAAVGEVPRIPGAAPTSIAERTSYIDESDITNNPFSVENLGGMSGGGGQTSANLEAILGTSDRGPVPTSTFQFQAPTQAQAQAAQARTFDPTSDPNYVPPSQQTGGIDPATLGEGAGARGAGGEFISARGKGPAQQEEEEEDDFDDFEDTGTTEGGPPPPPDPATMNQPPQQQLAPEPARPAPAQPDPAQAGPAQTSSLDQQPVASADTSAEDFLNNATSQAQGGERLFNLNDEDLESAVNRADAGGPSLSDLSSQVEGLGTQVESEIAPEVAEAASAWTTIGAGLSGIGAGIGAVLPVLAPILAGVGLYEGFKGLDKEYSTDPSDPFAKVRGEVAQAQDKLNAMGQTISADQFASQVGAGQPKFGSLAAPVFDTSQQTGVGAGHF